MVKSVADYDILSYFNMWNLPLLNKISVDTNPKIYIYSQMQDIGYNSRNAMIALGTFTFAIFLYFIQFTLLILITFYLIVTWGKCKG